MKRYLPSLVFSIIVLVCTCVYCEDTKLVGPIEVEVNQSFDVAVEGLVFDLGIFQLGEKPPQLEWKLVTGDGTIRSRMEVKVVLDETTKKTKWVVSPYATVAITSAGDCSVVLMVVNEGIGTLMVHEVTVGPFPEPEPKPEPEPLPPDDKVWGVILIEESMARTPDLAKILVGTEVSGYLESKGLKWMPADQDAVDADGDEREDLKPYADKAKKEGLPMMFIVGINGTEFYAGPVPKTPKAVIAEVAKCLKGAKR